MVPALHLLRLIIGCRDVVQHRLHPRIVGAHGLRVHHVRHEQPQLHPTLRLAPEKLRGQLVRVHALTAKLPSHVMLHAVDFLVHHGLGQIHFMLIGQGVQNLILHTRAHGVTKLALHVRPHFLPKGGQLPVFDAELREKGLIQLRHFSLRHRLRLDLEDRRLALERFIPIIFREGHF